MFNNFKATVLILKLITYHSCMFRLLSKWYGVSMDNNIYYFVFGKLCLEKLGQWCRDCQYFWESLAKSWPVFGGKFGQELVNICCRKMAISWFNSSLLRFLETFNK